MGHTHGADIESIRRIPDPQDPVPRVALPTVALFALALTLWCGSTVLAVTGAWPWPLSTAINAVAAFVFFTVAHESAHNAASIHPAVNTWLGRVAILALAPALGFRAFRFIHMQHHRFTNDMQGRDPDHYTMAGPAWQRPLRFLTLDLSYLAWYAPQVTLQD